MRACHRNTRELLDYPCEVKLPLRVHQLVFFRWAFVVSYAIIAGLSTAILMTVTDNGGKWVANLALDAFLLIVFLVYARNAHKHNVSGLSQCIVCYQLTHPLHPIL